MSDVLDVVCGLMVALSGFVGLIQGLTIMIVRGLVVSAGFFAFQKIQFPMEKILMETLGVESSASILSVVVVVLLILLSQQVIAWVFKKMRDAMMLGLPDRLMGFGTGLLLSSFFVIAVCLQLSSASSEFTEVLESSRVGKAVSQVKPYFSRVFSHSEKLNIEILKDMVK